MAAFLLFSLLAAIEPVVVTGILPVGFEMEVVDAEDLAVVLYMTVWFGRVVCALITLAQNW